jgi:hypothetical protein
MRLTVLALVATMFLAQPTPTLAVVPVVPGACPNGPLTPLLAPSFTCLDGDLVLGGFAYTDSSAPGVPASGVTVAFNPTPGAAGFTLTGPWTGSPNFNFGFTATGASGALLTGASLRGAGSVTGGGADTIFETICPGGPIAGCPAPRFNSTDSPLFGTDAITFPGTSNLGGALSGTGFAPPLGTDSITSLTLGFTDTPLIPVLPPPVTGAGAGSSFTINSIVNVPWGPGAVATFIDPNSGDNPSNTDVTIDWGDGSSSSGSPTFGAGSNVTVNAGHTFNRLGTFPINVNFRENAPGTLSLYVHSLAIVTSHPTQTLNLAPTYPPLPTGLNLISGALARQLPSNAGPFFTLVNGMQLPVSPGQIQDDGGYFYQNGPGLTGNPNPFMFSGQLPIDALDIAGPVDEGFLIGNPFATPMGVTGAWSVETYTPGVGYQQTDLIPPGMGARVMSDIGAVELLPMAPLPGGAGVAIEQLDIVWGPGQPAMLNTDYLRTTIVYPGSLGIGYLNVSANGVWGIQNLPILSTEDGGGWQSTSTLFGIGAPRGQTINSLSFGATLTPDTGGQPPETLQLPVTDEHEAFCGDGTEPGLKPAGPVVGGKLTDTPPVKARGTGKPTPGVERPVRNFPNQWQGALECGPASVSNSLHFLNDFFHLGLAADAISIDTMKTATGWKEGEGAPSGYEKKDRGEWVFDKAKAWETHKDNYMQKNKLPFSTKPLELAAFLDANGKPVAPNPLVQALKENADVEMNIEGHVVAVVRAAPMSIYQKDGPNHPGISISYVDDIHQTGQKNRTDPSARLMRTVILDLTTGKLTGEKTGEDGNNQNGKHVRNFVVERYVPPTPPAAGAGGGADK